MDGIGAHHGRGRRRGRGDNFVRDDDFRALRRQVETLQNKTRRGFARMRVPIRDDEDESMENASLDTKQREEVASIVRDPFESFNKNGEEIENGCAYV